MSTALTTRQEFGAQESTHALVETASTAIAAKAKAMVEARYVMAMRQPRNWDQVRQDLMSRMQAPLVCAQQERLLPQADRSGCRGPGDSLRGSRVALHEERAGRDVHDLRG
jgi:hypothetical protein